MIPTITESHVQFTAIRAQGAGGQNVNKVASAVHLRFDINASPLSAEQRERLLACGDSRITNEGELVIKAQRFRTLERNRSDALERLNALLQRVLAPVRPRRPTRPGRAARQRRVDAKTRRGQTKKLRRAPTES